MSDNVIALVITIAIIALFFAWMPILNFICPPCGRFVAKYRLQRPQDEKPHPAAFKKKAV